MKTIKNYFLFMRKFLKKDIYLILLIAIIFLKAILQLLGPLVLSTFIDRLAIRQQEGLIMLATAFLIIVIFNGVASVSGSYLSTIVGGRATNLLREKLLAHVLTLDDEFYNSTSCGDLLETIEGDVDRLNYFFSSMGIIFTSNALLVLGVVAVSFANDLILGCVQILFVFIALLFLWKSHQFGMSAVAKSRDKKRKLFGFFGEILKNTETIQITHSENYIYNKYKSFVSEWKPLRVKSSIAMWFVFTVVLILQAIGYAVFLSVGTALLIKGLITVGTVYLFYTYINYVLDPLLNIQGELQELQEVDASISHIQSIFDIRSNIIDSPKQSFPNVDNLSIQLEDVHFSYVDDQEVLTGVSLTIEKDAPIAIIGRTGVGKTTIASLIMRFYNPDSGRILVNGTDIRDLSLKELRTNIAYISQDSQLLETSIRNNITLFDNAISDERILKAINQMGISEWFAGFKDGLDTVIGAKGRVVSRGEAQIISSIRAFVRDSKIVIFDEITSKMDPLTEQSLFTTYATLLKNRVGLVIAHRMHTITSMNTVAVIESGKIIEYGATESLLNNPGSYLSQMFEKERDG